jgi:hypothetical protein
MQTKTKEQLRFEYDEIKKRIHDWIASGGDGEFSNFEIDRDLDLIEPHEKAHRQTVLMLMVQDGKIKQEGKRRGVYRVINKDVNIIDYKNANTKFFYLAMPLNISMYCRLFAGSLIAISGEKNVGKTAFALNIVKLNQNRGIPINYMSSEMQDEEFAYRLSMFDDVKIEDWNFKPIDRNENFEDILDPNAINIIDYLEIYDSFYKIGSKMANFYQVMRKGEGCLIVFVQKNPRQEHGRGDTFLIEKPRITISLSKRINEKGELDGAICTATNIKFPAGNQNINGLSRDYKIINGSEIIETGPWYYKKK